ncbi:MAG TPA: outer membrane beta-barrel protein [Gemmatimonadales bacterium]|nr:outer membrane beta-barrel protein [Gemmatimonadales bacterium]
MPARSFDIVTASAYTQDLKVEQGGRADLFTPSFIHTISQSLEESMQRRSLFLAFALAAAVAPTALNAQSPSSLADRFTVAAAFGGHSGAAEVNPTGTANWQLGWAGSIDANYWIQPKIGVRVGGTWAQDSLEGAALTGRGKFNKFAYDASVVLRYPVAAGIGTFIPYVLGGAGAVSLHQLGSDSTWTKFAGNFGAGIEYRFSRIGVRAEARDYVYKFDRYGYDKTQHDVAWQGGVTLSF